jgi:hypothetical protein
VIIALATLNGAQSIFAPRRCQSHQQPDIDDDLMIFFNKLLHQFQHAIEIFIKIKATIPDSTTVNLHFEKIPEEENELLINIIKVLGKSDLGITKVFLE